MQRSAVGILDDFELTGQCAIVTGAGTGLGREMALHLAEAGCDIVGAGRRAEPIEAVGEEIRATGRRYLGITGCDVTDSTQVDAMVTRAVQEMGRVTILVNNAGAGGTGQGKTLVELTDDDWRSGIASNLDSAFFCTRAIVPHLLDHGGGTIINITSAWGYRAGRDRWMYPVAKGGLIQLTKAIAMTYARDNIRCVCIAPGVFPHADDEPLRIARGERQPGGRVGYSREIGPLAVYLASPAASYMSGETVLIDGGVVAAGITPAGVVPRAEG
ncbi:MAG: SDR family oxidoreductase [Chloroflexi bacterium]|nr:SDR family oxidoreductase [Chloroflexota bacterium]